VGFEECLSSAALRWRFPAAARGSTLTMPVLVEVSGQGARR
jgi:hypothetical protein